MFKIPDDLYHFQRADVSKILSDDQNWLDLSEMGTGKTPVALAVSDLGNFRKTLIVCPNSLKLEWARQIEDWLGIEPSVSRRSCYRRLETLFEDMLKGKDSNPFFIVNYETFRTRRHLDVLNLYPFDLIILDEGHRLRNPKTKQTKGMLEFYRDNHSDTKLLVLTGSPIVNNPADLHSLLCLVKPEEFSPRGRMSFINEFCYYSLTRYGIHIWGVKDMEKLKELTAPYTIRHTKEEVLPFLPEKYYRRVLLEMDEKQRELYDRMEQELWILLDSGEPLHAPNVLSLLTRLRQLNLEPKILGVESPSSKTNFLNELLEDIVDAGRKVVVFSCFEKYIMYLHYSIKYPHVMITGNVPVEERQAAVKLFQTDPSIPIALGTIQVMGEGITLTAASDVVMMDRWWNPAVNMQAVDRLHRIGQKNAVQIIQPINEDTIDHSLDKILTKKQELSSAYLGEQAVIKEVLDDMRSERRF